MESLIARLKDTDYVIVSYATKLELLKLRVNYPDLSFKIITPQEVKAKFLGKASDESLFALLEKYSDLTYSHAKIINSTIVFPHSSKLNQKLRDLAAYKEVITSLSFLSRDPLVVESFEGKKVLLPQYLANDSLLLSLLKSVNSNISFSDINMRHSHKVMFFHTGVDEVYAVLNNVAGLLANGVSSSAIKIIQPNSTYENLLRKFAPQFKIKLAAKEYALNAFPEVNAFVEQFKGKRINKEGPLINTLSMSTSAALIALYNLILSIDFDSVSNIHHYDILSDKIKSEKITLEENNGIEFIKEMPLFSAHDTHYFFLNFANGRAPVIEGANPYLNNIERRELGLLDDESIAIINENKLIESLRNNKNVHISFSEVFGQEYYELSTLVSKLNYEKIPFKLSSKIYSQQYLNYLMGVSCDKTNFYKKEDEYYTALKKANPQRENYGLFNYEFKGIDYEHTLVSLSPTSVDLYQRLPFDYFAQYLLHIRDDRPSIYLNYGNFVHDVLENSTSEETFKACFTHYLDQNNFTAKDRFFVENNRAIIEGAFTFNNSYLQTVYPVQINDEVGIKAPFAEKCVLKGRLDRVMLFEENDQKYVSVIDFKTGAASCDPRNFEHGIDLQLPIYGLLLSLSEYYKDYQIAALVLNSLKLSSSYSAGGDESLKAALSRDIKYTGMIVNEPEILQTINATATTEYSFFKLGGRGKIKKPNYLMEQGDFDRHLETTRKIVRETFDGILNNKFPVQDKRINKESSAKFSQFKELSFLPRNSEFDEEDDYGDE